MNEGKVWKVSHQNSAVFARFSSSALHRQRDDGGRGGECVARARALPYNVSTLWQHRGPGSESHATAPRPFFATSVSSFSDAPRGRFSPRSHWLTRPVVTLR